jgi:hypothetical protein
MKRPGGEKDLEKRRYLEKRRHPKERRNLEERHHFQRCMFRSISLVAGGWCFTP